MITGSPCMGLFLSSCFFDALCCFFVWPGRCFFFPACGIPMTPRAGVVEVGRRNEVEARSAFPYPHLDGAEHGVRLRAARGAEDAGVVLRDPARSKAVTALALAQIVSLHLWRRGTNTTTNRGEPALRARVRRDLVFGWPLRGRTMKQSFASAARPRGGGPILLTAWQPWASAGCRHLGSSSMVVTRRTPNV